MTESFLKNRNSPFIIACIILAVIVLNVILGVLFRPLWFDEALTIIDFVSLANPLDIYRNYNIPNNHIVYNILLRFWIEISGAIPYLISMRLFSVLAAVASLVFIVWIWGGRFCRETALTACFCFAASLPFAIYASAIRGYMLSFLLILISLETALRYRDTGKTRLLIFFFILAFLATGVMPTNLIAFAAIYLLLLSSLKLKGVLSGKSLSIGVIPVIAFFIFYAPISGKLLKSFTLAEGWSNGLYASIHFYSAFIISFLPLLALAVAGSFLTKEKMTAERKSLIALIFLSPLIIFLLKSPSPFPRAFFCLWPVWIFILCSLADPLIKHLNQKFHGRVLPIIICLCLVWGMLPFTFSVQFSDKLSNGGQDDFFKPYFMRGDFNPLGTVRKSMELADPKSRGAVFVDFAADYPSIVFYGRMLKVDDKFWAFDKPWEKVASLGNIESIYVVARNDSGMESIAKRFNLKSHELEVDCGYQKIYRAKLK